MSLTAAFIFLRQKFSFPTYMVRKTGAEMELIYAPISGVCVIGIRISQVFLRNFLTWFINTFLMLPKSTKLTASHDRVY